jgi:hypothetical protein
MISIIQHFIALLLLHAGMNMSTAAPAPAGGHHMLGAHGSFWQMASWAVRWWGIQAIRNSLHWIMELCRGVGCVSHCFTEFRVS